MNQLPTVSIYTRVYNTKPYLRQCIDSVLGQSYTNFEYIIIDNGCTDGSQDLLREYAKKDLRIKLIRFDENAVGRILTALNYMSGEWIVFLDSDDWLDPAFLERLLFLAEENELDMVCTGTYIYYEYTGEKEVLIAPPSEPQIISRAEFFEKFPQYYSSSIVNWPWGKLIRLNMVRSALEKDNAFSKYSYNMDTLLCFRCFCSSKNVGIDNSVFHHYRRHKKSVSFTYADKSVFDSAPYLHSELERNLKKFAPHKIENIDFIDDCYCRWLIGLSWRLKDSPWPIEEKLEEQYRMFNHPLTKNILNKKQGVSSGSALKPKDIAKEFINIFFATIKNSALSLSEKLNEYFKVLEHPLTKEVFCQDTANKFVCPDDRELAKGVLQFLFSVVSESDLSSMDKLKEYRRVLECPLTYKFLMEIQGHTAADLEKRMILQKILQLPTNAGVDTVELKEMIQWLPQPLSPHCYTVITVQNAKLFLNDRSFIRKILGDQRLEQFYIKHHRMFMLFFGSHSLLRFVPGNGIPLFQSLLQDDAENLLLRLKQLAHNKYL